MVKIFVGLISVGYKFRHFYSTKFSPIRYTVFWRNSITFTKENIWITLLAVFVSLLEKCSLKFDQMVSKCFLFHNCLLHFFSSLTIVLLSVSFLYSFSWLFEVFSFDVVHAFFKTSTYYILVLSYIFEIFKNTLYDYTLYDFLFLVNSSWQFL